MILPFLSSLWGYASILIALAGGSYAFLASFFVDRFMSGSSQKSITSAQITFATDRVANHRILIGGRPPYNNFPVTILKPLRGAEIGLRDNLETFFVQDYPAPVQIVFGVRDKDDLAVQVVRELQEKYPRSNTIIVANPALHGTNAKVSNLINMFPAAGHDVLVLSDSDIAVPPNWLREVTDALEEPGVGLVTCLYTGQAQTRTRRFWPALSAMGMTYGFLPNVVLATSLGLATPSLGSTLALKRETLDKIGGFSAFVDFLADDYEIGRAVRGQGYRIAIPPLSVKHAATESTFTDIFNHELRWARTIRAINPRGYVGSAVTFGIPFALISVILLRASPLSLWTLGGTLIARLILKHRIDTKFGTDSGSHWLLPLRDLLSFMIFPISLFGNTVQWRETRFEIVVSARTYMRPVT
jgi:ceramide glucosyltransferase